MNVDVIRQTIRTQPFQPFSIHLSDGRAFPVPHPDYVAVATTQVIWVSPDDESVVRLAPAAIVSL